MLFILINVKQNDEMAMFQKELDTMSAKQEILDFIENKKYDYVEISHRIHERPELGNEEIFASRTLIDILRAYEFEIETDIAGHATGFIASYDSNKPGPTIGF